MSEEFNPVRWFEIYVQDIARAKRFYEEVFQVKLEPIGNPTDDPSMELWGFPPKHGAPGCSGALVRMNGKDSGPGGTIIYFACEDCAVESSRVAAAGVQVQGETRSIGQYGFIAYALDPEGNLIGFHSMN